VQEVASILIGRRLANAGSLRSDYSKYHATATASISLTMAIKTNASISSLCHTAGPPPALQMSSGSMVPLQVLRRVAHDAQNRRAEGSRA
jgi:hypothetical protein